MSFVVSVVFVLMELLYTFKLWVSLEVNWALFVGNSTEPWMLLDCVKYTRL